MKENMAERMRKTGEENQIYENPSRQSTNPRWVLVVAMVSSQSSLYSSRFQAHEYGR